MLGLRWCVSLGSVILVVCAGVLSAQEELPISEATEECLTCHEDLHPGIVGDWRRSRHAQITPEQALKGKPLTRRISAKSVPEALAKVVVGCAECHTLNPDTHKDTFNHEDHKVHTVVSPPDCATCHPEEREQYSHNLMSTAHTNLLKNGLYTDMVNEITCVHGVTEEGLVRKDADPLTLADSCLHCHGTKVEVVGTRTVERDGEKITLPRLKGWPNQGVGRINPDGSAGACTSCHARHQFSIAMARKPATCGECHKGPDVPAYPVYQVSKHGNIYNSVGHKWNWTAVPWRPGKDYQAPTCAGCHVSLIVGTDGEPIVKRTHRMNDRLSERLFGLPYAHPHPISADTSIIVNKGGLPLPTELTGEPVSKFLIDAAEQKKRRAEMQKVCSSCHSTAWTLGHFERLDRTIETTNAMTLSATQILLQAWDAGIAKGPADGDSVFNDGIEKRWVEQWLFYSNSIRFASAMGGADYGTFANGRWYLSRNLREMHEWVELHKAMKKKP